MRGILVDHEKGIMKVESIFTVKEIQEFVGNRGYFEIINPSFIKKKYRKSNDGEEFAYYINENGFEFNLPINSEMDKFMNEEHFFEPYGSPLGRCLILKKDKEGETVSMNSKDVDMFLSRPVKKRKREEEEEITENEQPKKKKRKKKRNIIED